RSRKGRGEMLRGEKVILRAPKREDLPRIAEFRNDVEFELLGGGDPWWPVPNEVIEAEFSQRRTGDDRPWFAIEADGKYIGGCGFVEEGRLRQHVWSNGQYGDFVFMGLLRDEWEAT